MPANEKKILMIEDDPIDQLAFKRLVKNEELSYNYTIAGSVSEAITILKNQRFDLIFSDYHLPDGTAFEILNLDINIPIILATGAGDEQTAVKAMKSGAYDYMIKDPDRNYLKVLPVTINKAIKQKKMEDEHKRWEEEREKLIKELQESLEKIRTLSGLVPICANCKKIRDDKGFWNEVEIYISQHSMAEFSHGICPDCMRELYPEYINNKKKSNDDKSEDE